MHLVAKELVFMETALWIDQFSNLLFLQETYIDMVKVFQHKNSTDHQRKLNLVTSLR